MENASEEDESEELESEEEEHLIPAEMASEEPVGEVNEAVSDPISQVGIFVNPSVLVLVTAGPAAAKRPQTCGYCTGNCVQCCWAHPGIKMYFL